MPNRQRWWPCSPAVTGKQAPTGNKYPNADTINIENHISGEETYALDLVYKCSDTGKMMCKVGVLDVDQKGKEGVNIALAIRDYLKSFGISALISFSGNKGFHVTIISEPVLVEIMTALVEKIKKLFPYKGEAMPYKGGERCKLAPCIHQRSGNWSYYFNGNSMPDIFDKNNMPDQFYESQLEILQSVKPTNANVLSAFAVTAQPEPGRTDIKEMIPDLKKCDGSLPPCGQQLVNKGGSPKIGTWDKNNICLASMCKSVGLQKKESIKKASAMAQNAEKAPRVESTKSTRDKIRHFHSIWKTPSVNGEFHCPYMLVAKKDLGFKCENCPARPSGVAVPKSKTSEPVPESLVLEKPLAEDLIVQVLNGAVPVGHIAHEILPYHRYRSKIPGLKNDPKNGVNMLGILFEATINGYNTPTDLGSFIMHLESAKMLDGFLTIQFKGELLELGKDHRSQFVRELKDKAIWQHKDLKAKSCVPDKEYNKVVERAVDLTIRYKVSLGAKVLAESVLEGSTDIYNVVAEHNHANIEILSQSNQNAMATMSDQAEELLKALLENDNNIIPTPFSTLNYFLGGGLHCGKLYIPVAQPGGGKTTFCAEVADFAASNGVPVIYVAMEMGRTQMFFYGLARSGRINSAKIESSYDSKPELTKAEIATAADSYLKKIGPNIRIIEGDHTTSCAKIQLMVTNVRAELSLTDDDPVLVVIDYLQLLSTGDEKLDISPNETSRIDRIAVSAKRLARDSNAAVLAISDITKEEQGGSWKGKEMTMNSLRGSNRLAHAPDCILALYSEPGKEQGGKAETDPWKTFEDKVVDSEKAIDFIRNMDTKIKAVSLGGDGATALSRVEIIKNRGGHGKGSQFMLYHRAYHSFEAIEIDGQDKAEGRG